MCCLLRRATAPVGRMSVSMFVGCTLCVHVGVAQDKVSTGGLREVRMIQAAGNKLVFSPDGKRLAGITDRVKARIWEVETGKELRVLTLPRQIWIIAFSPDGKRLVANENYTIRVWELESGKEIRSWQTPAFTRHVLFTANGRRIISGHDDGIIRIWDAETAGLVRTLRGHTDWVPGLALSLGC